MLTLLALVIIYTVSYTVWVKKVANIKEVILLKTLTFDAVLLRNITFIFAVFDV